MTRLMIRKDVYDELMKAFGHKDMSKLTKKQITDKNGHTKNVWVRMGEEPEAQRTGRSNIETEPSSSGRNPLADKLKTGDNIKFAYGGNTLSGEIIARGMKGVQVRDGDGNVYKVDYEKIIGTTAKKTSIMGKSAATDYILNADSIKTGWRGTDGMQPESCDTIEGLYKSVEAVRGEFNRITDSITNKFKSMNPIVMKRATLKNEVRIKEKLREDANAKLADAKKNGVNDFKPEEYDERTDTYHCRTIRDCDGHTICMNSIADVANILKHLDKQPYAARIKNNFAKPSPVGYSDINANIKLSNGVIVEMQINTTANMVAKERYGHSLYEVFRSVKGKAGYEELSDLMGEAQKSLYGLSNEYSKKGTYPVDDIPLKDGNRNIFDSSYKHEPFAAAIRENVKKAIPLFKKAKAEGILTGKTAEHFEHLIEYIKQ